MSIATYNSLLDLLEQILRGESSVTPEEFVRRIQEAFCYDDLTAAQYDQLVVGIRGQL